MHGQKNIKLIYNNPPINAKLFISTNVFYIKTLKSLTCLEIRRRFQRFNVQTPANTNNRVSVGEIIVMQTIFSSKWCVVFSVESLTQELSNEIMDLRRVNLLNPLPLTCTTLPGA
jgi:hypothetical protein